MIRGTGRSFPFAVDAPVAPVKPTPPVVAPPEPEPAFGFEDTFDNRVIARTVERNDIGDPQSDRHIAWGISSDGHQWNIDQYGADDVVAIGGAGVDGAVGWWTKDESDFNVALDAEVVDIEGLRETPFRLEMKFRITRGGPSVMGSQFIMDLYLAALWIECLVTFDDDPTPSTRLQLFEDTSDSDSTLYPSVGINYGVWHYLVWEHDYPNGIARAKLWRDGMPEPDWQVIATPLDLVTEVEDSAPASPYYYMFVTADISGSDGTNWGKWEWDYIRIVPI